LTVDPINFEYEFYNETVVNSTYKIINSYYCNGENSCPAGCYASGSYVEGCEDLGTESINIATTDNDVISGVIILADYGPDSTCSPAGLVEAESIGEFYRYGNGICVSGQRFECVGNSITIGFCSAGDCSSGCTINATAPNGGCWSDIFDVGVYFRLACGSLDLSTGTIPASTTGTSVQTPNQVCAAANQADWTYGSGYYCYNGGSSFVQCYGSGNGVIGCPAGTSCHCAPGVECSNHGTTSPCTF